MAYPFVKMPTVGEFIEIAKSEFGAELVELVRPDALPGEPSVVRFLRRTVGGKKVRSYMLLAVDDGLRLVPTEVRNHCQALEIPPSRFGIELEMLGHW